MADPNAPIIKAVHFINRRGQWDTYPATNYESQQTQMVRARHQEEADRHARDRDRTPPPPPEPVGASYVRERDFEPDDSSSDSSDADHRQQSDPNTPWLNARDWNWNGRRRSRPEIDDKDAIPLDDYPEHVDPEDSPPLKARIARELRRNRRPSRTWTYDDEYNHPDPGNVWPEADDDSDGSVLPYIQGMNDAQQEWEMVDHGPADDEEAYEDLRPDYGDSPPAPEPSSDGSLGGGRSTDSDETMHMAPEYDIPIHGPEVPLDQRLADFRHARERHLEAYRDPRNRQWIDRTKAQVLRDALIWYRTHFVQAQAFSEHFDHVCKAFSQLEDSIGFQFAAMSWFPNLPHELAELFTQAVARAQDYSDELGSALRFNTEIDALSGKQPARPGVIHEFYLNNRELLQFGFERETSVPLVAPSISSNLMDYFDFTYLLVPQGDLLTQTDILTSNLAIRLTRLSMAEYAARDRNNPTIDRYLQGDTSPFIADRLHKWVNLLLAWLHHSNRRAGLLTAEQLQAVVKLESLATQTLAHVISIRSDVEELDWDSRGGRSSTFYSATVGWGSHQPDLREVRLYAQAAREARVEAMRSLGDPDPEMSLQALHDPDLYG